MDKQVNVYGDYQSQFNAMEITFTIVFAIELAVNMYCHWYEGSVNIALCAAHDQRRVTPPLHHGQDDCLFE